MPHFETSVERQLYELAWEQAHDTSVSSVPLEYISDKANERLEQFRNSSNDTSEWLRELTNTANPAIAARAYSLLDEILSESAPAPEPGKHTIVINIFGGPGAGKTTAAFEIAAALKKEGYVVEYAPEVAKEYVWALNDPASSAAEIERASKALSGSYETQRIMHDTQDGRVKRLINQCDFVVTDSPALLSCLYLKTQDLAEQSLFNEDALRSFNQQDNFNLYIKRGTSYEQAGRVHDESQAVALDMSIRDFLSDNHIYFGTYEQNSIDSIIRNAIRTYERVQEQRLGIGIKPNATAMTAVQNKVANDLESKEIIMAEDNAREYINISIPNTGYQGRESIREFTGKDGREYAQIKLPPHTPEVMTAEGPLDISNYTLVVPKNVVRHFENDPNYASVGFPAANKDGEAWNVNVQLAQGHWENPDAPTKEERGEWIKEDPIEASVPAAALKVAMDEYRSERRAYKEAQYAQKHAQEKQVAPVPEGMTEIKPGEAVPQQPSQAPVTPVQNNEAAKRSAEAQAKSGPVAERVKQR